MQSLLSFECDSALAGGISIHLPLNHGYLHEEGGITSSDGHCRAFDADSSGTIISSGGGVVFLKRLDDAVRDGDRVHAVVIGSAVNNDGSVKVNYLSPSVDGQAAAIAEALEISGIEPASVGFIECHGTGTSIGDPIEIAALKQAYGRDNSKKGYCAVGSVKSNIGHTDTAAGVLGLIKAVMSLKDRKIAPTVHYKRPNPEIDFENSPFFVNDRLQRLGYPKVRDERGLVRLALAEPMRTLFLKRRRPPMTRTFSPGTSLRCQRNPRLPWIRVQSVCVRFSRKTLARIWRIAN